MYLMLRWPNFKIKAVTLSYDDDVIYDKHLIEILDKYNMKCTFNLNSEWFIGNTNPRYLTKEQAIELLKDSSHEVACHGARHLSLIDCDSNVGLQDVVSDKSNLEQMFGTIIEGMAYAYGTYNDTVVEYLKHAGIKYSRTVNTTHQFDIPTDWLRLPTTCHHDDPMLMELALKFIAIKDKYGMRPQLFYLWGHAYEFNDNNNWNVIEDFCEAVANKEDIWYATNIEIYNYVQAFNNLIYSNDKSMVKNPSAIDVFICDNGVNYLIPAGKTIKLK